jgi:ADP-ribosylglycohydrolase
MAWQLATRTAAPFISSSFPISSPFYTLLNYFVLFIFVSCTRLHPLTLQASMAVRLAESLRDQGKFDRDDVVRRYTNWHMGPPHDTGACCHARTAQEHLKIHPRRLLCGAETAYDTGLTFATVFRALKSGKSVEEATQLVAHSAGCNAAHRCPPLAMAAFIADDDLVQTTMSETKITHVHQLAVESAVASSRICRELIQGSTWDNAISKVCLRHSFATMNVCVYSRIPRLLL